MKAKNLTAEELELMYAHLSLLMDEVEYGSKEFEHIYETRDIVEDLKDN